MVVTAAPNGLTGMDPIPYGERRWNGAVWPPAHVDAYNRELERIAARHRAGYDVQHLINGLYNLAHQFDEAGRPPRCSCAKHGDGSVTTMLCPAHAETDPCTTVASVTGKRRKGTITRGKCTNCGWETGK